MSCTHGAATRIAIDGKEYGFTKFDPHGVLKQLVDGSVETIRGFMELDGDRVTEGPLLANFSIHMEATWKEFTQLLPDLGFEDDGYGDWILSENPPNVNVLVEYEDTDVHKYTDCKCGEITIRGQKGTTPVQFELTFFAKNWQTGQVYSASAITDDAPYAFHQCGRSSGGSFYLDTVDADVDRFAIHIDRHMYVEHNNSVAPTDICPRYTEVTLATSTPFDDTHQPLLDRWLTPPPDPIAVEITFAGSDTRETVFTFPNVRRLAQGVPIPGKVNIRDGHFYRAWRIGSDRSIVISHVDA